MQEKRTDELDELLETMKPEQLGDYYKDNKKYMADDKKTFSYYCLLYTSDTADD